MSIGLVYVSMIPSLPSSVNPGSNGQIDIENAFTNSGSRKQGHDLSAFKGLGILDRFLTLLDFF